MLAQMPETDPTSHDADYLLGTKDQILTLWRGLPPEHQATIALVLVAEIIDGGEYDVWLRQAIAFCRPEHPDTREEEDFPF